MTSLKINAIALLYYNHVQFHHWLAASTCSHGDVHLFDGYTDHDGVAEVCINGVWGDICDNNLTVTDQRTLAEIFCRQFTGEASPCRSIRLLRIKIYNVFVKPIQHISWAAVVHNRGVKEIPSISHSMVSAV